MKKKSLVDDYRFYAFVIAFLIIISLMYHKYKEGLFLISLITFTLYSYEVLIRRKMEWTNYVDNLSKEADVATHHAIRDVPIPMVLVDQIGNIIWYNTKFLEICETKKLINMKITELMDGMDIEDVNIELKQNIEVSFKDKHYKVEYNILDISHTDKNKVEHMTMLYFKDTTEYIDLKKKYTDEKVNIGFIYIDNYEELMDESDEATKFMMFSEIDKKLNLLSRDTKSIIKKTDRNKYLMIFDSEHINFLKKFEILDEIRSINLGNTIPVTLSMGIGIGQDSLEETHESARAAMDIALGRGGDQAVIKDGDNLNFYGGSVQALEKRTKVKARAVSFALKELIDQSDNIFIMGHKVGDMDSFGACIGIYRIAKNRGKKCFIILNSVSSSIKNIYEAMIKEQPSYLDDVVSFDQIKHMSFKSSIGIVVDTHIPQQTEAPELLKKVEKIIVIDHHRRGESFIEDPVLSYVETYASSTCELVTEMLYYIEDNIYITDFDAKAMLAGIAVDTKNFAVNTGVRTFEAASFLRKRGADALQVRQLFQNDLDDYKFKGEIIKNISLFKEGIAISKLEEDTPTGIIIAAQAADEILNIKDINAVFVLAKVGKGIHISGRSKDAINVQRILEKLGGGGHMTVAGAKVKDSNIEQAESKLKAIITEYLGEGEEK